MVLEGPRGSLGHCEGRETDEGRSQEGTVLLWTPKRETETAGVLLVTGVTYTLLESLQWGSRSKASFLIFRTYPDG